MAITNNVNKLRLAVCLVECTIGDRIVSLNKDFADFVVHDYQKVSVIRDKICMLRGYHIDNVSMTYCGDNLDFNKSFAQQGIIYSCSVHFIHRIQEIVEEE